MSPENEIETVKEKQTCSIDTGCPICDGIWWLFRSPYVSVLLRVFLGGIFVYASVDKIMNPVLFARAVMNYEMLPYWAVNFFALILPWFEFIAGIMLILGFLTRASSSLILATLIMFGIAITTALVRGLEIDCGCFSVYEQGKVMDWTYVARDLVLIACALQVVFCKRIVFALDNFRKANLPSGT